MALRRASRRHRHDPGRGPGAEATAAGGGDATRPEAGRRGRGGGAKPMAGGAVKLYCDRREVAEIYGPLNENRQAVTGADGTFEFDTLLPGYKFRFLFSKGKKDLGPE